MKDEQQSILENDDRLVLGTVQLGMPYGVANKDGMPTLDTALAIVHEAWSSGVREFDTAQGYGSSEEVLGKVFADLGIAKDVKVISKFEPTLDHMNKAVMLKAIDTSLNTIGISQLFGIMLHREELLSLWDEGLKVILQSFVKSGKVKHIGVSVYTPEKAIQALNTSGIDIVQLPTNILDRRFVNAGVFKLALEKRKTVYVRSVFLQGLILMTSESIPRKMAFAKPVIKKLDSICKELGLTRHELAFAYIKTTLPEAKILFGADNPDHVANNVKVWRKKILSYQDNKVQTMFEKIDERIINPYLW
jgi:aryl-alcohol dehydrogenase-like predicted oxidoreductase